MSQASNTTLLALLLTLSDLEEPLTAEELESLNNLGYQMDINLEWDSNIQPNLLNIVRGRPVWNQKFTETKAKLDGLGEKFPQGIIPTPEEVERVLPSALDPSQRGHVPKGKPEEEESHNLKNVSLRILMDKNPQEAAKKMGLSDKLK